ncbi:ATP-dependent RNA helicase mrh4, mitochondrial [Tothia fuscella]|uniref:RNA helicase n=1 Tax=Tothia fuscella TaxID=1048955 RepID=A0A9P4P0N9_9PEZI|nr:ATP-dependent RNA helicase mrh4, mitochondrial [Tothia fuscella]
MLRSLPSLCLFCELRTTVRTPWQQTRSMAQGRDRRPSRMVLSPSVAKPSKEREERDKGRPKSRNSPWAAVNQTEVHARDARNAPRQRSSAELKRSTQGKETKKKDDGGYKALKMQQSLSTVSYGARAATKDKISTIEGFSTFELLPVIQDSINPQALKSLGDISPTPIQKLAIPALLGHQDKKRRRSAEEPSSKEMEQFLLAAETGSGKTLAYLLPAIDALKRVEATEAERTERDEVQQQEKKATSLFELASPEAHVPDQDTGRPKIIILVPTAELVDQVGELAKSLSHTVKYRAALISSAYTGVVIRNRLFSPKGIDLLVSTPHLLASITKADPNVLSRVTHLIVDEADSLFDRSFSPLTCEILDRATPSLKQLVLCSATIPKRLDSYLRERFPNIRRLATPNLHAIPRRVQLGIVDVEKEPYQGNKDLACADTIWLIGKSAAEHSDDADEQADWQRTKRIIVFVNEREKTIELTDYLITKGIDATALNRDVDLRKQGEILSSFTDSSLSKKAKPDDDDKSSMNRKEARKQGIKMLPNTKVLVVTDLASRGIDTTAVRHVVLYDVPHTTIDFIHRLGRTGRMGRRGRGIVLVGKGDRRDVVKEVREGMFKGQALI